MGFRLGTIGYGGAWRGKDMRDSVMLLMLGAGWDMENIHGAGTSSVYTYWTKGNRQIVIRISDHKPGQIWDGDYSLHPGGMAIEQLERIVNEGI